jgi:hypothetical protein
MDVNLIFSVLVVSIVLSFTVPVFQPMAVWAVGTLILNSIMSISILIRMRYA